MSIVGKTLNFSFELNGSAFSQTNAVVGNGNEFGYDGAYINVSDFSLSFYDIALTWFTAGSPAFAVKDTAGVLPPITWVEFASNAGQWPADRISFDANTISISVSGFTPPFTGTQFTLSIGFSPTAIALSGNDVTENVQGAVIGTLSNNDFDGTTTTYTLAPNAYFVLDGSTLKLKDGVSLDYEAQASHQVTVTATDGKGAKHSVTETFKIDVADVVESPVLSGDLTGAVDEGGTYVLTAKDLHFTDGDSKDVDVIFTVSDVTNGTLIVDGAAATSFTGAQLKAGLVAFAHNDTNTTSASFALTVQDETSGPSKPVTFNLDVAPINDIPVVSAPIADQGTTVGATFSFAVPAGTFVDLDGDALTYSVSGLPAWLTFDATTNTFSGTAGAGDTGIVSVTVSATDGEATVGDTFDITVTEAAVAGVSLTSNTVAENSAKDTEIGTLGGVDADGDALVSFSLGNADPDNAKFAIVDGKLVVAAGAKLDFESQDSYEITITATDNDGGTFESSLTIDVTDVAEDPKGTKKNDRLEGDALDNLLFGKKGNDKLTGNDGADTFMFSKGKDKVLDFDGAEGDMIDLSKAKGIDSFEDLMADHVKDTDAGFKIIDDKGDSMFLKGIDAGDLTADMFMF